MAGRAVLNHVFPAMRLVNLTGYCINVKDHRGPIVRIVKPSDERAYPPYGRSVRDAYVGVRRLLGMEPSVVAHRSRLPLPTGRPLLWTGP
jgi:hypothetical protein